jgi:hypothetical protein
MREKGACSRRRALQSRNRKTGALPLWSYCDNLSPTSSTISQPIECTGQTPRRTHSCVQRAHSCVRDMFHCFLARFPLQSERPGLRPGQKRQEPAPFLAHFSLRRKLTVTNELMSNLEVYFLGSRETNKTVKRPFN